MDLSVEFQTKTLSKAAQEVDVDYAWISEDMAYKKGPMIAPRMVHNFILTRYEKLTKFLLEHGIDIINLDSDGNVEDLIPIWLKVGINGIGPCEVAAGMDIVALRKKYPDLIIH